MLINSFLLYPYFFFLLAQVLLKIKVSVEPCLASVVVLMRGCSGTDEYEAGKEKNHYVLTTKNKTTPLDTGLAQPTAAQVLHTAPIHSLSVLPEVTHSLFFMFSSFALASKSSLAI